MAKALKKELGLMDVYAIGTGTTISGGFFLLPGLAAFYAGPALIVSYLLAMIPLVPAILCKIELSTAMPRSGGMYYAVDRTMGPMAGTVAGIGTWLTLTLKTAFALIGMGAYLSLFIQGNALIPIAIAFAVFFGLLNLVGAKEASFIQVFLVVGIVFLVGGFIATGLFRIEPQHYSGFLDAGFTKIFGTAGLVYISYMGLSKITSVAEEVKDPEKNLPLGMFLSLGTVFLVYFLGTIVIVGVLPMAELQNNLTSVASTADRLMGKTGILLVTIAAVLSFSSATNAGILSASRYPLAMSRDHLLPRFFKKLSKNGIPRLSVIICVLTIILFIVALDPIKIAKLASSFMLLMFALNCLAVIIMRESHIEEYDPGYKAPFYPWLPLFGIFSSMAFIIEMGQTPLLFTIGLIAASVCWYMYYARDRVDRGGAILHVFERLGRDRHEGFETELRGILKEKGLRHHDPYDQIVGKANVIDINHRVRFDTMVRQAAAILATELSYPSDKIVNELLEGTKVGGTPVSKGAAIPHLRLHHLIEPELLIVRAKEGVDIEVGEDFWGEHKPDGDIHAIFFLISPEENPKQHLRILAKIAGRIDDPSFLPQWQAAKGDQELKELLLRDENFINLKLRPNTKSAILIDKMIKDIRLPEDVLVAIINRDGVAIVPSGKKVLKEGDQITVIGSPAGIAEFRKQYF